MIVHTHDGLTIHCLVLGELMTNCYVLRTTAKDPPGSRMQPACWVVDPGLSPGPLLEVLRKDGLSPQRILLTHGHGDHIAGVAAVKKDYPDAVITAPAGDARLLTDPLANMSLPFGLEIAAPPAEETLNPGDTLQLGKLQLLVEFKQ